ncbi:Fic family protein, partial [Bacteroides congonensis]
KKTTQENNTRKPNKQDVRRQQLLEFCSEPKSLLDIMQHLGLKARKNVMNVYITPMIDTGVLKMTEPNNPTSRNQMYVTVKMEQGSQEV